MSSLQTYTGSNRPSSPAPGDAIYLTDANKIAVYDGDISEWRLFSSDGLVYNNAGPNELHYTGGIFDLNTAPYYVSTSPDMHFDASFINGSEATNLINGDAVSAWGNRSGNANFNLSQGSTSLTPIFYDSGTIKGVYFDSADYFNLANSYSLTAGSSTTQIIVHTNLASGNSISGLSPASHGNANAFFVGGGQNGAIKMGAKSIANPPTFSGTNPNLHIVRKTGLTFEYWYQGGTKHDTQTASSSFSNTFTKMFTLYNTAGLNARIHECLVFPESLSIEDLNKIRGYLESKYSLGTTAIS